MERNNPLLPNIPYSMPDMLLTDVLLTGVWEMRGKRSCICTEVFR
jgi:hypothetical protein